jgi:hypothetical protein
LLQEPRRGHRFQVFLDRRAVSLRGDENDSTIPVQPARRIETDCIYQLALLVSRCEPEAGINPQSPSLGDVVSFARHSHNQRLAGASNITLKIEHSRHATAIQRFSTISIAVLLL